MGIQIGSGTIQRGLPVHGLLRNLAHVALQIRLLSLRLVQRDRRPHHKTS